MNINLNISKKKMQTENTLLYFSVFHSEGRNRSHDLIVRKSKVYSIVNFEIVIAIPGNFLP